MKRRDFLRSVAGAAAGAAIGTQRAAGADGQPAQSAIPVRALGRTGLEIPILGLGGFHVGSAGSEADARAVVEAAYEEGIRFFDNAESYQSGQAERWMGSALRGIREQVVLMTKTFDLAQRNVEGAKRHLEGSLERLQTDYLDIWQLHSVRSVEDVDRAFGPGGAMEYILDAQRQGLVRHVGVTGHAHPEFNLRALEHFDRGIRFDVMQMPVNPIDYHQRSFQRAVLPALVERGIGVIAMKTSAQGRLASDGICTVDECLRYVWSLPVNVAVVGMERPELVRRNAQAAREFTAMPEVELRALRERIRPRADLGLEWYKGG
jgi:aryl-alcohol dehydrogenase-like predicted oxidoreductase